MALFLTSILSTKKNPTLLPYHLLAGAPTMVRSAVQYNQRRLGIVTMHSYYSMLLTLVSLLVCRSPVLSPCLGFTSQVSGIKYPLSHLNSLFCHVSHLLSHISCLISHIFHLISHTFPVSRLPYHIFPDSSAAVLIDNDLADYTSLGNELASNAL